MVPSSFILRNNMDKYSFQYRFRTVCEITPEILEELGITAIAVDLDNTLVFDATFKFRKGASLWVETIKESGFPVIIVSNTSPLRAVFLAQKLKTAYISLARKPSPKGILKAAAKLNVDVKKLGMVGDQIFADVEAANLAGAIPLLVDPARPEVVFGKYFRKIRKKEQPLLERFDEEVGYYVDKRQA